MQQTVEGRAAGDGTHHPVRQAEPKEDRRRIDHQLVLEHVGAEQKPLAHLVERGADREVENQQGEVETDRVPAGVGLPGREPGAQRPREEGMEPAEKNQPPDEERFVMPVAPVDHSKQWR